MTKSLKKYLKKTIYEKMTHSTKCPHCGEKMDEQTFKEKKEAGKLLCTSCKHEWIPKVTIKP